MPEKVYENWPTLGKTAKTILTRVYQASEVSSWCEKKYLLAVPVSVSFGSKEMYVHHMTATTFEIR